MGLKKCNLCNKPIVDGEQRITSLPGNESVHSKCQILSEINNYWVVEWSESQGFFHIHQIGDAIRDNKEKFIETGRPGDYVPVGIALSHEDACKISLNLREQRASRQ